MDAEHEPDAVVSTVNVGSCGAPAAQSMATGPTFHTSSHAARTRNVKVKELPPQLHKCSYAAVVAGQGRAAVAGQGKAAAQCSYAAVVAAVPANIWEGRMQSYTYTARRPATAGWCSTRGPPPLLAHSCRQEHLHTRKS